MNPAWGDIGAAECDLASLPEVEVVPRLPNNEEAVLRLAAMGVLFDEVLQEAMAICPRQRHALEQPLLDEVDLEGSALRLPWWHEVEGSCALIPGHYETAQVFQLLRMRVGDRVLLLGPRGNYWTELLVRVGASELLVIEPDEMRRATLIARWEQLGLDELCEEHDCEVRWGGCVELANEVMRSEPYWDRMLLTGALPRLPLELLRGLTHDGQALVVVGDGGQGMLQLVTPTSKREWTAQHVTHFGVDDLRPEVASVLEGIEPPVEGVAEAVEASEAERIRAWTLANNDPIRDRFAPERILRMMADIWNSAGPVFAGLEDAEADIRTKLADDLFRLGNTLGQLNVIGLAGEHHAESFRLLPSAESATLLGWSYSKSGGDGRDSALAWYRRAIETDPTLGNAWNDIGALLLDSGELKEAVPWLSTATQAPRYDAQGFPWLNLARVHEMLGNKMAAFEAAREALEHLPDDEDALRIFDESGAGLI